MTGIKLFHTQLLYRSLPVVLSATFTVEFRRSSEETGYKRCARLALGDVDGAIDFHTALKFHPGWEAALAGTITGVSPKGAITA